MKIKEDHYVKEVARGLSQGVDIHCSGEAPLDQGDRLSTGEQQLPQVGAGAWEGAGVGAKEETVARTGEGA